MLDDISEFSVDSDWSERAATAAEDDQAALRDRDLATPPTASDPDSSVSRPLLPSLILCYGRSGRCADPDDAQARLRGTSTVG